ncbi:MAG: DMT family transporter [Flavobacterium sp.]|nr:DMT family transporter [Flavobacterium sp.]
MISKQLKWILLITLALIWGSSFILMKKGLLGLNPFQIGALRIIFTSFFVIVIGFKSIATIKHFQWKYIALTSLFGTFVPAFLFPLAETKVSSSICSILNSLTPLNTLLIGVLTFGLTYNRRQFLGIIIGLFGTAILIFTGDDAANSSNYYFSVFVIIASICYAINVNLIKKYLSDVKPLAITTGNFLILLVPALLVLFFTDFKDRIHTSDTQIALIYILILGVIGTGIANIIFFKLIQMSSALFATSVTYLIPIVAFFWGILDHESLTFMQLLGAFVVLIGVYLANKK